MAIEFHCDHCGKQIRTSDDNAGRRGKCPFCQLSVYIPTPSESLEPLGLSPVDPNEIREKRRQDEESRRVIKSIRSESEKLPPDTSRPKPPADDLPPPGLGDARLTADLERLVIDYVSHMAAGRLNEAQELAKEIGASYELAEEVIQRLTMDDLPPARLAKIPRPVLIGFLKQLKPA